MTTIRIDAATRDQGEQILAVLVEAFEQYRTILDPPSGVFHETPASIRRKLEMGGGFVARDSVALVGVVLYQPYPDYMYLGRLGVLPAYRGGQIATRLCASVEQAAQERGLPRVQLAVRLALTDNQRFFQSLGYQVVSYHSHEGYTEATFVTMEKALTP
jgi:ribosomal protein S18 acetylase RimI-like enzyme